MRGFSTFLSREEMAAIEEMKRRLSFECVEEAKEFKEDELKSKEDKQIIATVDNIKDYILNICRSLICISYNDVITYDNNGKILGYKLVIHTKERPRQMTSNNRVALNDFIDKVSIPICATLICEEDISIMEVRNLNYGKLKNIENIDTIFELKRDYFFSGYLVFYEKLKYRVNNDASKVEETFRESDNL